MQGSGFMVQGAGWRDEGASTVRCGWTLLMTRHTLLDATSLLPSSVCTSICHQRVLSSVFKIQGSGFRVQGSGFRVRVSEFRAQGSGFRVQGAGFKVKGAGFRVQNSGCRVQVQGQGFRVQGDRPTRSFIRVAGASTDSALLKQHSVIVDLGFGVYGLGFRVQGSGFRVQGVRFRVWECVGCVV